MRTKESVKPKLVFGLLPFLLSGCNLFQKEASIYEDGFLQYIHLGDNSSFQLEEDRSIVIVGFNYNGLQQERIDIPKEINGFEVKRIGLRDEGFNHNNNRSIECGDKIKKIFLLGNIDKVEYFDGENVDFFICNDEPKFFENSRSKYGKVYIPNGAYLKYLEENNLTEKDVHFYSANVRFDLNYLNDNQQSLYRIDHVDSGEKIYTPEKPTRDGYEFSGWYTEKECLSSWDFNSIPTLENEEFVLYAGWNNL